MKGEQAVAELSKRLDYIRKCYHNHFDRDAYDGLGSMNQEMFILNSLAAVADMLASLEKPKANPREWADNQPQIAWTIGCEKGIDEVWQQLQTLIKELRKT